MHFRKDSPLLGLLLGLFIPVIFYFLQDMFIQLMLGKYFDIQSMKLFALMFNLHFFRYYLMNLNFEKTGKGILFATFIYALIWVFIYKGVN